MKEKLEKIQKDALAEIESADSLNALQDVHNRFFGKKGSLTEASKGLGRVSAEERPHVGQMINLAKTLLTATFEKKKNALKHGEVNAGLEAERVDITAPGSNRRSGHIHPLSQVQREV